MFTPPATAAGLPSVPGAPPGVALTRGGRLDAEVWAEFAGQWDALQQAAAAIRERVGAPATDLDNRSEVQTARDEIAQLAGKPRRGQGRGLTPQARLAVERHAMSLAQAHYQSAGWNVEDVSRSQPYDLRCSRSGFELRVEVKGTTSGEGAVLLTAGEVNHARQQHPQTALYIVYGIHLEEGPDGVSRASGGHAQILEPWSVDVGTLAPIGYEYLPPHVRGP